MQPSIDLQQYVKTFLETGDYSAFGEGDEERIEPAIVSFSLEHEIIEIISGSTSIEEFAKLLITEIQLIKFKSFIGELEQLVDSFDLDYRGSADEPDYNRLLINLSFGLEDESKVDNLIRHVRDKLANNFIHTNGKYPLGAYKSYIMSANCWSVEFQFAKSWDLLEDIQP